jgi:urease accessory protein
LEQGRIAATDTRLLESSLGLAGRRGLGTLVMASGTPWTPLEREALLHTLQATVAAHPLSHTAGATSPNPQLIVLRALAPMTESLFDLFKHAWAKLRTQAWGLPPQAPRIWSV